MNYPRDVIEVNDCLLHRVKESYPFASEYDEAKLRLSWNDLTVRAREKSSTMVEKIKRRFRRISGVEELVLRPRDILHSGGRVNDVKQLKLRVSYT